MPAKPDFSFLLRDVDRQHALAQEALAQAKAIDLMLASTDEKSKEQLMALKEKLLHLADSLTANATTTSVSSTELITSLSKR